MSTVFVLLLKVMNNHTQNKKKFNSIISRYISCILFLFETHLCNLKEFI